MLKEIHEQPDVIARTAFDRIDLGAADVRFEGRAFDDAFCRSIERVQILACGARSTPDRSFLIEGLAGIPVDFDYASEFRYRRPRLVGGPWRSRSRSPVRPRTPWLRRASRVVDARTAAICNVAGSTQVRESEATGHAGPEIGVATKAFTAEVTAAILLAVRLAQAGALPEHKAREGLEERA